MVSKAVKESLGRFGLSHLILRKSLLIIQWFFSSEVLKGPEWLTGTYHTREFTSQEILTTTLQTVVSQSGRNATKSDSSFLA